MVLISNQPTADILIKFLLGLQIPNFQFFSQKLNRRRKTSKLSRQEEEEGEEGKLRFADLKLALLDFGKLEIGLHRFQGLMTNGFERKKEKAF